MACATCTRWMVWNDSDFTQTFYYYDCTDGTTLLYAHIGSGQFYSVCGCQASGSYASSNDVYIEDGGTGYINFNGFLLPACEPTASPSITPSPFPTRTPNHTPTQTPTPTITPTISLTPSPTPIICGSGVTTGTYYYTDCCGNFIQGNLNGLVVVMDYTKPYTGVVKLNSPVTTTCASPTPTPTPTLTPTTSLTPTITPTITPTSTTTPTPTPSSTGLVYTQGQNECQVFTLFDLGVQCYPINIPASSTSNDGILSLLVTGGTSPYSFYWEGGQRTQTLSGIPQGTYEVTVVDYYGDYTATTVCSLFPPSPTPTSTVTPTPTMTPSPVWPSLCFAFVINIDNYIGPVQFVPSGNQNGRPTWTGTYGLTTLTVLWSTQNSRWEIQGWNFTAGLPISTNQTNVPDSLWTLAGGPQGQMTMVQGTCGTSLPLYSVITKQNSSCSGPINPNGSITMITAYGVPPYLYSIDGGVTYQSSNIFSALSANTYTVKTKDSTNSTLTNTITVGYDNNPTTYEISVNVINTYNPSSGTEIANWEVSVFPTLPVGVTISFDLNVNITKDYYGPGSGTISDTVVVTKNNVAVSPSSTTTPSTQNYPRPNCSPYTYDETSTAKTYSLSITNGDVISGTSTSILTVTNGVVGSNGCVTTLQQSILAATTSPTIQGGPCFSVITNSVPQGIQGHTLQNSNTTSSVPMVVDNEKTDSCARTIGSITQQGYTTSIYSFDTSLAVGTQSSTYSVNVGDVLVFDFSTLLPSVPCTNAGVSCVDLTFILLRNNVSVYTDDIHSCTPSNNSLTYTYTVPAGTTSLNVQILNDVT